MTHRNGESRVILKLFLIIGVLGLTMSFFREDKKDHSEGRYSRMGDPIVPAKGVSSSNFPLFPWSEETNTRDKDTDRNKDKDTNETQDENKEKGKDKDPEKEYPFDHTEGIIGRIDQAPDDAYDNLFHVQLPFLSAEIEGRLEYEVQGSPGTEIYLSLNHEASQKETLTRKGWQKKIRYLTPLELRSPDNVLLFSAPEGTTYRIKNPKIYLSSGASPRVSQSEAVLLEGFSSYTPDPVNSTRIDYHGARLELPAGSQKTSQKLCALSLREVDLPPLEPSLVNVTRDCRGYRFLPHGAHFEKQLHLSLAYDSLQLPSGYSPQDIKIYYFDETTRRWNSLPTDSVDSKSGRIVSLTDHFTDFIAGVLKTPESPETAGYTPTQMSDLQAVSPTVGIEGLTLPSANSSGSATTRFGLKLPEGRSGLTPGLALSYSSESGNGWIGLGWNLNLSSLSVDTRWGVPRFDPQTETETYILDGEMLTPTAHRSEIQERTPDKPYYPRREENYSRITRKGNSPSNYYWIVEGKTGIKQYYGGVGSVEPTSVLKDAKGNIADWALVRTEDLNGNRIDYTYEIVENPAVSGGNPGFQRYIRQIRYTTNKDRQGKYTVDFEREQGRKDIQVSGRLGFKQVTADLLKTITVRYDNQPVRSYELNYQSGRFHKTLLRSITEKDTQGKEFYTHTLEYHDEVGAAYQVLSESQPFHTPDENLSGGLLKLPLTVFLTDGELIGFGDKTSSISGARNSGYSAGSYFGVGINDNKLNSKSLTLGGKYLHSGSDSEVLVTLTDMNGDGLPDKVFKVANILFYRPNQMGYFGNAHMVSGINSISKSKSRTDTRGLEASPYAFFVGWQKSTTTTTTPTYFLDFNGDGLTDAADNGRVVFSHIDSQGHPGFSPNSNLTPSPITESSAIDKSFIPDPTLEQQQLIENNPLHDVVKLWKAPFDGKIQIQSQAELLKDLPLEAGEYSHADGVQLSIQYNSQPLTATRTQIPAGDFSPHTVKVEEMAVSKGDRLYFRVQSVENGNYDKLRWDPEITYLKMKDSLVSLTDSTADGLPYKRYQWSEDYTLSSAQQIAMPKQGTIRVSGHFTKPITSDSLILSVVSVDPQGKLPEFTIWEKQYDPDALYDGEVSFDLNVSEERFYSFRMTTRSNINWANTRWSPKITYTSFSDGTSVLAPNGDPLLEMFPAVSQSQYTKIQTPTVGILLEKGTYTLPLKMSFSTSLAKGKIYLTLKQKNHLIQSRELPVIGSGTAQDTLTFTVPQKGRVYFECIPHLILGELTSVRLVTPNDTIFAGISLRNDTPELGTLYRGWGQFAYNGNKERADQPIHEGELNLDQYNTEDPPDVENISDPSQLDGFADPGNSNFIPMIPNAQQGYWQGTDPQTFAGKEITSSSRKGEKDMTVDVAITHDGSSQGLSAVIRKNRTTVNSYSGGAGIGKISGSYSETHSETSQRIDMMDMNGDKYPDVVDSDHIQYTNPRGILSETIAASSGFLNKGESKGFTLGGTYVPGHTSEGQTLGTLISQAFTVKAVSGSEKGDYGDKCTASIGISGNFSNNTDQTHYSWLDINGDGLPDKVHKDGNVELNLGYGFLPKENWGHSYVQENQTGDYGSGLGVNWDYYSIGAGIGLSLTDGRSDRSLIDVNGDGLPDMVSSGLPYPKVRLNTGAGFSSEELPWKGLEKLGESRSVSQSKNMSFTACFTPFIIPVKICVNPQVSSSFGISREQRTLADMNGDGFPDYVVSKEDGKMSVNYSTIGRTNLLKKVNHSLGSSFTLNYKQVGNTYETPGLKWVLSEVEVFDGHKGDGVDTSKTTFDYQGGYYDRNERQSYGFAQVRTHQIDTQSGKIYRTTTQEFYNRDYYRSGRLKSEWMEDKNGKKYTESKTDYVIKDAQSGAEISENPLGSMSARIFIAPKRITRFLYQADDNPMITTENYTYDTIGNVTLFEQKGDGSPNQWAEAQMHYYDYQKPYLAGVEKSRTIVTSEGIKRKKDVKIDPATGNITQIGHYPENGDPSLYEYQYDNYGNLTRVTGPANAQGQRMWKEFGYDEPTLSRIVQIKDAFGYTFSSVYDHRFGIPTETTDINGQKIRYVPDEKGRVSTITGPYELAKGKPYTIKYEYHPEGNYALTRHYDPQHPDILTYTFTDGLGRPVQVKKTASLFTAADSPDQKALIVSGRVNYDAFGRAVESYHPITENPGSPTVYNPATDAVSPTKTEYDLLDRPVLETLPDGSKSRNEYLLVNYNGIRVMKILHTDAMGSKNQTLTDALGRTLQTLRHSSAGDITTKFEYNALGELLTVTDTKGNETRSEYDRLGRRTKVEHPDAGTTRYKYDPAGNLTERITAQVAKEIPNGGAIKYNYDYNRLASIAYPKNYQNNVSYAYGKPGDKNHRAGRLYLVTDASGGRELFYGRLGELTKEIRTIRISSSNIRTYVSNYEYDSWGRITQMIYPDGEKVHYRYNSAGNLYSVFGEKLGREYPYIDRLGYDKFEQRVYLKYGNGTQTTYNYEPQRRRLGSMKATLPGGGTLMNNNYLYDAVSNVLEVTNTESMNGSTQQQYEYDDLYRLTKAYGELNSSKGYASYSLMMKYDNLHNITHKELGHTVFGSYPKQSNYELEYQYSQERPHQLSQIKELTVTAGEEKTHKYSYDPNGNMVHRQEDIHYRSLIWDEENRLMGVNDEGYASRYVYDDTGKRVLKSSGGVTQVSVNGTSMGTMEDMKNYTGYLSPYFVFKEGSFTKHIYAGTERIVSQIGNGEFNNNSGGLGGNGITAGSLNFAQVQDWYEVQKEKYIASLGVPPGPPDKKGIYASPQYTGKPWPDFGSPLNSSLNTPPKGWPKMPVFNPPGGPPGPPVQFGPAQTNDSVNGGYGYSGTGTFAEDRYFYHHDHLGSSSYLTNQLGNITQHVEYIPFGEVFVEERNEKWNTPYLFNGKELDEETGLYYYGARYYSSKESVWLSVDPLAEKYPGISPYTYCLNNPVNAIDPDGRYIILVIWTTGTGDNGVGHAGIAVSNYKQETYMEIINGVEVEKTRMVADGTYTLYENWPGGDGVDFDLKGAITSVEADRLITIIGSESGFTDGSTVSPYEKVAPDGVLKLTTSYEQDMAVKNRLETANEEKTNYNGAWYNCSSFSSDGLKGIFGKKVGRERMLGPIKSITPNQLWKDTQKEAEKKGIKTDVLKDPGSGVDNKFKETMKGN